MLRQRLYLRIYFALVDALALAAILIALLWRYAFDGGPWQGEFIALASEVATALLPPPSAPARESQGALDRWHQRFHTNLALYDSSRELIAAAAASPPALDPARH